MASQVFTGSSNFSYTNNVPGRQNVRIVINYMESKVTDTVGTRSGAGLRALWKLYEIRLTWQGVSLRRRETQGFSGNELLIGDAQLPTFEAGDVTVEAREILSDNFYNSNRLIIGKSLPPNINATDTTTLPTEILLPPGETLNCVCGVYNIVVIPENG
jgi:hypothetical protein